MSTGIKISDSCLEAFNKLKVEHKLKYIVFKVSEDKTEIIVEKASDNSDYEAFLADLPKDDCRYAIYDFDYEEEVKRNKILFYTWSPDAAKLQSKMLYTSFRVAVRVSFIGIGGEIQGTGYDDISYESVLEQVTR